MRILVTGGAGYLGSVLVEKLLDTKHTVCVLDILLFGGESLVPFQTHTHFSFIKGDIRNKKVVKDALKNIDVVIHLAALVGEPACKIDPKLTEEINYKATVQLAKLAKESGVKKFFFSSTCSNYGVSDNKSFAKEETPLHPQSMYAETKIKSEKKLLSLNDSKFHVCIFRFATLFGLSLKMRFNLIINELLRDAYAKGKIAIYNEDAWRPFAHTQDAADALMIALQAPIKKISGQIFNMGTENLQKKEIVNFVKKEIPGVKIINQGKGPDSRDYRVSFEKLKKTLGFLPKKSVKGGVQEIMWSLENNIFLDVYDKRFNMWINEEALHAKKN